MGCSDKESEHVTDSSDSVAAEITINNLKTITIPFVEFEGTPLTEALAFLMERSVELSVKEENSTMRGISFILTAPQNPKEGFEKLSDSTNTFFDDTSDFHPNSIGDTLITFKAENISIWDALNKVVRTADLVVIITDAGRVAIGPPLSEERQNAAEQPATAPQSKSK